MDDRVKSLRQELIKNKQGNNPWRPVGFHILFGFLWIYLSDRLLSMAIHDRAVYEWVQTFKGALYVTLTGGALYFLIRMDNSRIFSLNKSLSIQNEELVAYSEELTAADQELNSKVNALNDLTEKLKKREVELLELATKDHLTELQNRVKYEMDLEAYLQIHESFNVLIVGIDDFKKLNNYHGHNYGDALLKIVGQALSSTIGYSHVYRSSGSEFIILLPPDYKHYEEESIFLIKEALSRIQCVNGLVYTPSACIGVVRVNKGEDVDSVYKKLNVSLLHARENGINTVKSYSENFEKKQFYNIQLDEAIRKSMDQDLFDLNFQPIYSLKSGQIVSYEVLLRWPNNELGEKNIGHVIERAEKTGQILDLDKWVLRELIRHLKSSPNIFMGKRLSMNVSSRSFHSDHFYKYFMREMKEASIHLSMIELEITEYSVIENLDKCRNIMEAYKKEGVKIALDDFGTEFSSLNYLSKLPFDTLKIDKSYIDDIESNKRDEAIVKHIVDLSRNLGLIVIAEGIETRGQEDILKSMSCDCGQGYLKSRPVDISILGNLVG
ncbi:putative bifunctional diguanylate cyclase/phosphodiesterase [Fusibacter sp. JL216-2]|uniref:putative bifunctional diguanylate cyclase/phosphodiesterase n=1 Tax=Fusibacter sp. JL216-2 TaxID=3071453 RepID=UPI003D32EEA4